METVTDTPLVTDAHESWSIPLTKLRLHGERNERSPKAPDSAEASPSKELEIVLTTVAPSYLGLDFHTSNNLPVAYRPSLPSCEMPSDWHHFSPSSAREVSEWLLGLTGSPPRVTSAHVLVEAVHLIADGFGQVTLSEDATGKSHAEMLEEALSKLATVSSLGPFAVGHILSPRDDDPHGPSPEVREFSKRVLMLGLAHTPGRDSTLTIYTPLLRRVLMQRLAQEWIRNGSPLKRPAGWADVELRSLHAIDPSESPDRRLLCGALIDVRVRSNDERLYFLTLSANRLFESALYATVGCQPPRHWPWPNSRTWFGEWSEMVDSVTDAVRNLPAVPDDEYPRPTTPAKVTLFREGSSENRLPADFEERLAESVIDLSRVTPLQRAQLVLEQADGEDFGALQGRNLRNMGFVMGLVSSDGGEGLTALLLRTAERLSDGIWPGERVHVYLDGGVMLAQLNHPGGSSAFLRIALSLALQEGSSHSAGHAVEILVLLARGAGTPGERRRLLVTAAKIALAHDASQFERHALDLISVLHHENTALAERVSQHLERRLFVGTPTVPRHRQETQELRERGELPLPSWAASGPLSDEERERLYGWAREGLWNRVLEIAPRLDSRVREASGAPNAELNLIWGLAATATEALQLSATVWSAGATGSGTGAGLCALHLCRLKSLGRDFDGYPWPDASGFPFPLSSYIAYVQTIDNLKRGPLGDVERRLARLGSVSNEPVDFGLSKVLDSEALDSFGEIANEMHQEVLDWLTGEMPVPPDPLPRDITRQEVEAEWIRQPERVIDFLIDAGFSDVVDILSAIEPFMTDLWNLTERLWDSGEFGRARAVRTVVYSTLRNPHLDPVPQLATLRVDAAYSIASLHRSDGDLEAALEWVGKAAQEAQGVPSSESAKHRLANAIRIVDLEGSIYFDLGKYDFSEARHRRAVLMWLTGDATCQDRPRQDLPALVASASACDFDLIRLLHNYANSVEKLGDEKLLISVLVEAAVAVCRIEDLSSELQNPRFLNLIWNLGRRLPEPEQSNYSPLGGIVEAVGRTAKRLKWNLGRRMPERETAVSPKSRDDCVRFVKRLASEMVGPPIVV